MHRRAAGVALVDLHMGRPQRSVFGQASTKRENGGGLQLLDLLMLAHVGSGRFSPMRAVLPSVLAQTVWVEVDLSRLDRPSNGQRNDETDLGTVLAFEFDTLSTALDPTTATAKGSHDDFGRHDILRFKVHLDVVTAASATTVIIVRPAKLHVELHVFSRTGLRLLGMSVGESFLHNTSDGQGSSDAAGTGRSRDCACAHAWGLRACARTCTWSVGL